MAPECDESQGALDPAVERQATELVRRAMEIAERAVLRALESVEPKAARPRAGEASLAAAGDAHRLLAALQHELHTLVNRSAEPDAMPVAGAWTAAWRDPTADRVSVSTADMVLPSSARGLAAHEAERFFGGLASAARARMAAAMLERGPLTVSELVDAIEAQTTGQVYHHLKALSAAGLVEAKPDSRYGLIAEAAPRVAVALCLGGCAGGDRPGRL